MAKKQKLPFYAGCIRCSVGQRFATLDEANEWLLNHEHTSKSKPKRKETD